MNLACSAIATGVVFIFSFLPLIRAPPNELEYGYSLVATINRAFPPEMFAAAYGNASYLESLLRSYDKPSDGANIKDWVEQTPLHLAAKFGKMETARILLRFGANVNARNRDFDETPLHLAAKSGYIDMVQLLIEKGANVDAQIKVKSFAFGGGTPMTYAIETGNSLDTVGLLVQQGSANINLPNLDMLTPLHLAVKNQNLALVKFLLDHGANIEARDIQKRSPLNYLVSSKDPPPQIPMIAYLVSKGADIESQDGVGRTPLQNAVLQGHKAIVKYMIKLGASINSRGITGRTILHRIAVTKSIRSVDAIRFLLRNGADPNVGTPDGCDMPLHDLANVTDYKESTSSIVEIAKLMISFGANPNLKEPCSQTSPIDLALANNYTELVEVLQSFNEIMSEFAEEEQQTNTDPAVTFSHIGVDKLEDIVIMLSKLPKETVLERDWLNQSALHVASFFGRAYVSMVLTCFGFDIHARDSFGRTPLINAARIGNVLLIDYFLDRKADIEASDSDGMTPLLWAVKYSSSPPAVRLLIKRGANIRARNSQDGLSALHLAAENQNLEMLEILLAANLSANIRSTSGLTPLNYLLQSGCCYPQIPTVGILIKYGANVNSADLSGITPLHSAINSKKSAEVIWLLLYQGADPNAVDKNGCGMPMMNYLKTTLPDQFISDEEIATTVKWMMKMGANPYIGDSCNGNQTPVNVADRSSRRLVANVLRRTMRSFL